MRDAGCFGRGGLAVSVRGGVPGRRNKGSVETADAPVPRWATRVPNRYDNVTRATVRLGGGHTGGGTEGRVQSGGSDHAGRNERNSVNRTVNNASEHVRLSPGVKGGTGVQACADWDGDWDWGWGIGGSTASVHSRMTASCLVCLATPSGIRHDATPAQATTCGKQTGENRSRSTR